MLSAVRSMNGLKDVYVADKWYDCFNDSDIDGDGLLDYQELSSLDLGTFNETTGAYTHATVGDYCDIAETKGIR